MKIRLYKHSIFYMLMLVLFFLVFGVYTFKLNIPKIVLTLIIVIMVFVGDKNEILAISICCIPLHNIVDFYLIVGICAITYIMKNFRIISIGKPIILCLMMIIWEFLHCLMGEFDLKTTIGVLVTIFYLFVIICSDVSDVDYTFLIRSLILVCTSICLMLLAEGIVNANFNFSVAMTNFQRLGVMVDDSRVLINPNTLGVINVLGISGVLQIQVKDKKKYIFNLLSIAFLIVTGMLTSSRTFLVLLLVMLILTIIGLPGNINKKIQYFAIISISFLVIVFIYKWMFPYNFEFFLSRFQTGNMWNGRDSIMLDYNEYMRENSWVPLWGVGLSNFYEKVLYTYKMSVAVPHNGIQEVVVAWGIPGLVMIGFLILMMIIKSSKYMERKSLLRYIPLLIILTKSIAGQFLTSSYTMLALVLAYLSLCQDFNKIEE